MQIFLICTPKTADTNKKVGKLKFAHPTLPPFDHVAQSWVYGKRNTPPIRTKILNLTIATLPTRHASRFANAHGDLRHRGYALRGFIVQRPATEGSEVEHHVRAGATCHKPGKLLLLSLMVLQTAPLSLTRMGLHKSLRIQHCTLCSGRASKLHFFG